MATALHCLGRPWHAVALRCAFCLGVSYCEDEVGFIFVVVTRQDVHPSRQMADGLGPNEEQVRKCLQ